MRIAILCATVACASSPFRAPLHREHPLAGRIWNGSAFVDQQALDAAVQSAHFVLLGETHDNPDHHLLQARLVRVAAQGRKPAIVFEMLDVSQQQAVDAAPRNADAIAEAVNWAHGGWPDFSMYRPIFEAALAAGLPIVAGNFTRAQMSAIVKEGAAKLPPEVAALLQREGEPSAQASETERAEMRAEHCGMLPETLLGPMILAQHARDAQLAIRVAASETGSILIAGSGHVRNDRAVPVPLALLAPGRRALSVAFIEVSPAMQAPEDYARAFNAPRLPFDFAVFTPAAEREDPCKALEKRMKKRPA
ncbi:MAG TPA: ChaN family lipoprotein [Myxococcales bacterium]|nr:ChaN family lipoprotein [Myxococcales bacterium]